VPRARGAAVFDERSVARGLGFDPFTTGRNVPNPRPLLTCSGVSGRIGLLVRGYQNLRLWQETAVAPRMIARCLDLEALWRSCGKGVMLQRVAHGNGDFSTPDVGRDGNSRSHFSPAPVQERITTRYLAFTDSIIEVNIARCTFASQRRGGHLALNFRIFCLLYVLS
jgi:hypothetical protein